MQSLTTIPFSGFYGSLHDSELDDQVSRMFCDRDSGSVENKKLSERATCDAIDWQACHEVYAKEYAANLATEYGIVMTFESMVSPREYNFTTDRIFCHIDTAEVSRLLALLPREALDSEAEDRFTSRSGFMSFYSADVESWGDVETWDHNQIGTVVAAYIAHKHHEDNGSEFDAWAEFDLMGDSFSNGFGDECLFAGKGNGPLNRLCRIHDYLERRAERNS